MNPQKLARVMIFVVLFVALFGSALLYWQYSNMSAASDRLENLRSEQITDENLQETLIKTKEALAQYQVELDHLERGVPNLAYMPTMLTELEATGLSQGISVTGVRPMPEPERPPKKNADGEVVEEEKKPYREILIEVNGRGSYSDIRKLLAAFNEFPKIVSVSLISLQPIMGDEAKAGELEASVNLVAYAFPPTQEAKGDGDEKEAAETGDEKSKAKTGEADSAAPKDAKENAPTDKEKASVSAGAPQDGGIS
ncbi:MAG: type 4a pilus biogenesis protein PilO [Fimbriimonadaceae bacterium]